MFFIDPSSHSALTDTWAQPASSRPHSVQQSLRQPGYNHEPDDKNFEHRKALLQDNLTLTKHYNHNQMDLCSYQTPADYQPIQHLTNSYGPDYNNIEHKKILPDSKIRPDEMINGNNQLQPHYR